MQTVHGTTVTAKQAEAIERISQRWTRISEPQPTIGCDGAVVIQCFYASGASMWVIIETDGYAHS